MKTILVTGASSGIGRALTVRAARAGYAVYAVGRNMKALAALSVQVSEEGGTIKTDVTDIARPANAPALIGRMLAGFGHIDILVNNAGAVAVGPIAGQSDDDLLAQFGTHVLGPLALVREALPSLRATRGHVFMLGSGVARVPVGGLGAYPPSKAALRSATAILRRELVPLDIAVTYVDPGAVDTAFMSRAGLPGAPQSVLVSPELVARKILIAISTRPRVLNVAPLQTAAVAVAEFLPGITEAVLERNPQLIGSGPMLAIDAGFDSGRSAKIALPSSAPHSPGESIHVDEEHDVGGDIERTTEVEDDPDSDRAVAGDKMVDERAALSDGVHDRPDIVAAEPQTQAEDPQAVVMWEPAIDIEVAAPEPEVLPEFLAVEASSLAEEPVVTEFRVDSEPPIAVPVAAADASPPAARWSYEPPEADDAVIVEILPEMRASHDELFVAAPPIADDEPAHATSSFDAAIEPLRFRMDRSKLLPSFVRELLVVDNVLDVGETAMRWAGMPNKHERALTSEIFFALAEWGFLAPRADGRYRVLRTADSAL